MTEKNLLIVFLSLGGIIVCSGCAQFATIQLSTPVNLADDSLDILWEKIIERTDIDHQSVYIEKFILRTDSIGNIDSLQMLFSGMQYNKDIIYIVSLKDTNSIVFTKQDISLYSNSGPNPDQVFNAIHSYVQSGNFPGYANISVNLENGANMVFDNKYIPVYEVKNGQLYSIKHIAFNQNEIVYYLKICRVTTPSLTYIENNKFGGGSTKGVCEICERDCIILLDPDQLAKARVMEFC
jgi:hypothetical protein